MLSSPGVLPVLRGRMWLEEALGEALGWRNKCWGLLVWDPACPPQFLSLLQPRASAEDTSCLMPAGEGKGLICTRCPAPIGVEPLAVAFPAAEPKLLVEEAGRRASPRSVPSGQEQHLIIERTLGYYSTVFSPWG